MSVALSKGVSVTLLSTVTTGTSSAVVVPITSNWLYISIICVGTISTGTLIIEEASAPDYAGTWSQLGSDIDLTALTGGKETVAHINGTFRAVRVRVGTDVTGAGGSVTVGIMSN